MKAIIIITSLIILFCNSLFANNIPDHLFGIWIHGKVSSDIEPTHKFKDSFTYSYDPNDGVPDIFYTMFIKSDYFSDELMIDTDANHNIKSIMGAKHFHYSIENQEKFKSECASSLKSVIEILNEKHGEIETERNIMQKSNSIRGIIIDDFYSSYDYEGKLTLELGCQYFSLHNDVLSSRLAIYLSNSIEKFDRKFDKILTQVNFELLIKDSSGL